MITFVSNAYGGRASDRVIVEQSGLFEKLEPYIDSVMVDKGFMLDNICELNSIQLIRPPFLKNSQQFSRALETASIAQARVHVERVIQRLKTFKILATKLPWEMLDYIDSIMVIIAGIINLDKPVLPDDKF